MSSLLETVLLQQQAVKLLLGVLVILSAAIFVAAAAAEPNSSCVTTCGSLHDIPYPFGTSKGCYLDSSFLITCKSSSSSGKSTQTPFLGVSNIKVLNISLDGELRVSTSVARVCPQKLDNYTSYKYTGYNYIDTLLEFPMSDKKNVFIAVGCNTRAIIDSYENLYSIGCRSRCENIYDMVNGSCSGVGCCQAPIPTGMTDFSIDVRLYNGSTIGQLGARHAKMLRRILQDMHVSQRIVNVTIPQTVLGIAAAAPQAITETHTSLMVARILMSVEFKFMGALLMLHASTMWGFTPVYAPKGTKEMGEKKELLAELKEAILEKLFRLP
ncbi:wall-associated receptor kinase 2-like isoform X2 [Carya illinoinensis]|uniref:wall-associated receptor kinase 2-like isoform X2 n=1 Tax=Carya illinoinensis TaxID=32201 RepID=UPI001C71F015|nr:wall-associated receptor kinase 2-like isoform X2 [Carya illinoinensis]